MKNIYAVIKGEVGEGADLIGVHKTQEGAIKSALATPTCFPGGWVEIGFNIWRNGDCDWVQVKTLEIKK